MPVDDAFENREMAALYDRFNRPGPDNAFYLTLAGEPCRVLDIGCGTGTLALSLAALGHQVLGLEPARGMLALARTKDPSGTVDWVEGDALDFAIERRFDLIIMSGHVFQVFLDDDEMLAALSNACRHLAAGGRLAFECRNPLGSSWDEWTSERTRRCETVDGIGDVEVCYQLKERDGELVRFETVFDILASGERLVSESTLRFPPRDKIAALLSQAGFSAVDWLGDWDGSAFRPDSREIIAIAGLGTEK